MNLDPSMRIRNVVVGRFVGKLDELPIKRNNSVVTAAEIRLLGEVGAGLCPFGRCDSAVSIVPLVFPVLLCRVLNMIKLSFRRCRGIVVRTSIL